MKIEERLAELGLQLPAPLQQIGVKLPFPWVRVQGNRAFISGHGPLAADGSLSEPLGKVGDQVSTDQAYDAAKLVALAMLSSLKQTLGDLDRVTAWLRAFGMINSAPGFVNTPSVINGFSDLIIDLWGPDAGSHARSAVGVAALPFDIPVEIEAEVLID